MRDCLISNLSPRILINMKTQIITDNFNPKSYNRCAVHPLQSWQWGEARRKMGVEVLRLGEYGRESLKNVFQITYHKLPYTRFVIGYLPRSVIPSKNILKLIYEQGKKRNCIFVKIEPYIEKSNVKVQNLNSFLNPKSHNLNLWKSPHGLFPDWTQMIDLTNSEEELLKSMKPKTRYNVRLAEKKGVTVREMTSIEGFEIFGKLFFETTKRQKYHGHNLFYHKTVFQILKDGIAHILVAFYKNKPLAVYEVFLFGDVLYYPYGGSSLEYKEVMASNLLMWEAMKFGKRCGAKVFDMWGSLPPDYASTSLSTSDWAGFTRFKEGYGGEFVEFVGSYDLVISPVYYPLYNFLYKVRKLLL